MLPRRLLPSLARPAQVLARGSLRPAMAARPTTVASPGLAPAATRSFALTAPRLDEASQPTPSSLFNFTEEELMLRESGPSLPAPLSAGRRQR